MSTHESEQVEMAVAGLVLDPSTDAPIVVLKDISGETCLPIWIGVAEATAIASALKNVEAARPMTHDLLRNFIDELGARVDRIAIHRLEENTFFANIEVVHGEVARIVDARPSDAIALAVRVAAPIFVARSVLEAAKVTLVPVEGVIDDEEQPGSEPEEEPAVKQQDFTSLDKEQWEEILSNMDPDDFKYKM